MRLRKVILKNFKRFDDLTIDLGAEPKKIVALVGPNGSGKSSVFDAFEEKLRTLKSSPNDMGATFYSKTLFARNAAEVQESYDRHRAVFIEQYDTSKAFDKKSFYGRSPYRFTSRLNVENYKVQPNIIEDHHRPGSSIHLDARLTENYERLLALELQEWRVGTKSGPEMRSELLGKINNILSEILDIKISNLGDVMSGKGQLYFEKDNSIHFPFENLSSGEKEVVDIIIDLIVKTSEFNDTVYFIDEPELHLNTKIQRKLLIQIEKLIPEACQLWVATHSVGFLRALQEELKDSSQIFDFSEKDYFNSTKVIIPIKRTRANWQRIFGTALEDLTGLIAPKKIFYCEGKSTPSPSGEEQGLDAIIYNHIFEEEYPDILFVSAGGGTAHASNSTIALQVLSKAFNEVELFRIKDKDERNQDERKKFLDYASENRMLLRREIENYIFDLEILKAYCESKHITFNEEKYNELVTDIKEQDIKVVQQQLANLCNISGSIVEAKITLSEFILPTTIVYRELESCIF